MVTNKFMNNLCRFVGPYLRICPEHVFVVEDGDGICGYAVAAPDSKHFYEQFKKHWLPEVCKNKFSCYLQQLSTYIFFPRSTDLVEMVS